MVRGCLCSLFWCGLGWGGWGSLRSIFRLIVCWGCGIVVVGILVVLLGFCLLVGVGCVCFLGWFCCRIVGGFVWVCFCVWWVGCSYRWGWSFLGRIGFWWMVGYLGLSCGRFGWCFGSCFLGCSFVCGRSGICWGNWCFFWLCGLFGCDWLVCVGGLGRRWRWLFLLGLLGFFGLWWRMVVFWWGRCRLVGLGCLGWCWCVLGFCGFLVCVCCVCWIGCWCVFWCSWCWLLCWWWCCWIWICGWCFFFCWIWCLVVFGGLVWFFWWLGFWVCFWDCCGWWCCLGSWRVLGWGWLGLDCWYGRCLRLSCRVFGRLVWGLGCCVFWVCEWLFGIFCIFVVWFVWLGWIGLIGGWCCVWCFGIFVFWCWCWRLVGGCCSSCGWFLVYVCCGFWGSFGGFCCFIWLYLVCGLVFVFWWCDWIGSGWFFGSCFVFCVGLLVILLGDLLEVGGFDEYVGIGGIV